MICMNCVNDPGLVTHIRANGTNGKCALCKTTKKAVSVELIANIVIDFLRDNYRRGEGSAIHCPDSDKISHEEPEGETLQEVLSDLLHAPEDSSFVELILNEITRPERGDIRNGEEPEFHEDGDYVRHPNFPDEAMEKWENFKAELNLGSRFFNTAAKSYFDWLFEGIEKFVVYGADSPTIIRTMTKGTLYRGRRCDTDSAYAEIVENPGSMLGAAPPGKPGAGRMNAEGISVFYAAFERKTCIAELRPPVGSRVITGKFKLQKPIQVFDFSLLEASFDNSPLSIFDREYEEKQGKRDFLKLLHKEITRPVLPEQKKDYLATQVLAEYLTTQTEHQIDGIIFNSAQAQKGKNIAIFNNLRTAHRAPNNKKKSAALYYSPDSLQQHTIEKVKFKITNKEIPERKIKKQNRKTNPLE
ncbi:hypothetical protein PSEEN2057 [Pseudomonas entomophila L48]|uniref:RES domain-containing protein n=2 Tax=Pseudomonas entomophila TaxID=312306 RepID=Q1IBS7_PSEE4|nr:hypothetical protein PSEEN2057 [Pseudomonas entomophila L48]